MFVCLVALHDFLFISKNNLTLLCENLKYTESIGAFLKISFRNEKIATVIFSVHTEKMHVFLCN